MNMLVTIIHHLLLRCEFVCNLWNENTEEFEDVN